MKGQIFGLAGEAVVAKILGGSQSGEKTFGKKLFSHSDSQSNAS